jgi:hypothetical protein
MFVTPADRKIRRFCGAAVVPLAVVTIAVEAPTRMLAAVGPVRRAEITPVKEVGDSKTVPEPLAAATRICVALSAI